MSKLKVGNIIEKLVPFLLLASIVLAFIVGMLWQKVSLLKGGVDTNILGEQTGETDTTVQPPKGLEKLPQDVVSKIPPVTDEDHVRGERGAKVKIIEYSDFQCPYCERFHPVMQQVMQEYSGKVAWIYRHYPLDAIHPNARPAANASECVASLGGNDAFWKFTDLVFESQDKYLTNLSLAAADSGVDKSKYESCFNAKKFDSVVSENQDKGSAAGVTGTPGTFILNDKGDAWLIPGALPFNSIKGILDEALKV